MTDTISSFLAASPAERVSILQAAQPDGELARYLGSATFAASRRLASRTRHLGVSSPTNLIFVPGVMGSSLGSQRLGGIWWLDLRSLGIVDRLGLDPEGTADSDARKPAISPVVVDSSYMPFLTAVDDQVDLGHETFPYDWRKPLSVAASALRDRVLALHGGHRQPVHLVAHSMGGLVVRTALARHGEELWPCLGRIAFLATPHFGSPAIAGYLRRHLWGFELLALLGKFLSRETFRSLWGVLELLPAPAEIYPDSDSGHPVANFDLYHASTWGLGLTNDAEARLQRVLDAASAAHEERLAGHRRLTQDQRDRMLMVAGVGYRGLFRLTQDDGWFGTDWDRTTGRQRCSRHFEGDGRVPLASAELENVEVRYVKARHGDVPNVPAVADGVFRFLRGDDPELPRSCSEALASHLGLEEKGDVDAFAAIAPGTGDDPGYLDRTELDDERLKSLEGAVTRFERPEFQFISLL